MHAWMRASAQKLQITAFHFIHCSATVCKRVRVPKTEWDFSAKAEHVLKESNFCGLVHCTVCDWVDTKQQTWYLDPSQESARTFPLLTFTPLFRVLKTCSIRPSMRDPAEVPQWRYRKPNSGVRREVGRRRRRGETSQGEEVSRGEKESWKKLQQTRAKIEQGVIFQCLSVAAARGAVWVCVNVHMHIGTDDEGVCVCVYAELS